MFISPSSCPPGPETVRLFSPMSAMAVPSTTSVRYLVAAPLRSSFPRETSATFPLMECRRDCRRPRCRSRPPCRRPGRGANEVLFAVALDISRADVGVVVGQRRHHIAETEAVGARSSGRRMRRDVVLLHEAADRVDLRDAGNGAQLRPDHPS